MTATQLDKMRAGRERKLAAQRDQARVDVARYREFLKAESSAHRRMTAVRERDGIESDAYRLALDTWRNLWTHAVIPSDAAFAHDKAPV